METGDSVNASNIFKDKIKELYKLEETATNEFDRMIFQMMNENFRKHEETIPKLAKDGHVKINPSKVKNRTLSLKEPSVPLTPK
jgi:hypothetical protein